MEQSGIKFDARNLLADETSPYLLQHAANPVHWRPWGQNALLEAQSRDCPILLSVGYAACHWCHVMAHESFEDDSVASIMNALYVNVKVDREERPDIDQIYMAALSSMGEQGGWPLTMFLTPQGEPFWGGTYFPKQPQYGRSGFIQILHAIDQAWKSKRTEIRQSAAKLTQHVRSNLSRDASQQHAENLLPNLAAAILPMMDMERGGLRGAPKFPNAPFMQTLWLQWLKTGDPQFRDAVLLGLRKMLAGGIYDHVGGGLARYSTDADWMIPHFEKMLYDNALLIRLALWAFAETGEETFRIRIEQTITWLLREMRTKDGFASSFDADSEGEEGRYYTWTPQQLRDALGDEPELNSCFSLGTSAQWEGAPVLYQTEAQLTAAANNPEAADRIRNHLLKNRETRIKPGRDDKVLTDWNGLAIQALAEAGRALDKKEWVQAAADVFKAVMANRDHQNRLPHSVRNDRRLYPAFSSDYAGMINAAVSLYEATAERQYVEQALELLATLDEWNADEAGFGYYLTASDSTDVPIRLRGDVDEAIPAANAQLVEALARLATASGDWKLAQRAEQIADHAVGRIRNQQFGQAGIINAAEIAHNPIKLVLVDNDESRLVAVANRISDPRRVDIICRVGQADNVPELTEGTLPPIDKPGAWICMNRSCLPAITDPLELERVLKRVPVTS